MRFLSHKYRMVRRTRRLGFVGRVFAPVNSAVNVAAGVIRNSLGLASNVVGSVGNRTRSALGRVSRGANGTVSRVLKGGKRSRKSRKSRKSRR